MNISFDLDGTLIPFNNEFVTEKRSTVAKMIGIEKIRKDTNSLIADLQNQGHIIHIYTTSFRAKNKIKRTLNYYGISVKIIINQNDNEKILKSLRINSSKYPPAFGFDIHIDDLKGVKMEGEKLGFKTIIIDPNDKNWSLSIKNAIKKFSL